MASSILSSRYLHASFLCPSCRVVFRLRAMDQPTCLICHHVLLERIDIDSTETIRGTGHHERNLGNEDSVDTAVFISDVLINSGLHQIMDQLGDLDSTWRTNKKSTRTGTGLLLRLIDIKGNHVSENAHCAICLDEFKLGQQARELRCNHIFHSKCIFPWIDIKNSCPVCRNEISLSTENEKSDEIDIDPVVGYSLRRVVGGGFSLGTIRGQPGSERISETPIAYTVDVRRTRRRQRHDGSLMNIFKRFVSLFCSNSHLEILRDIHENRSVTRITASWR